jgi:tRNA-2-methylthio-N6-dimethylallyladenosine synthase
MNVRDSEVVKGLLLAEGYKLTDDEKKADIVLFNTCSVRQHAEDKVWSALGNIGRSHKSQVTSHKLKKIETIDTGKKVIGIIGCMAQNYKKKVFQRAPNVDFIVGPSDINKIPDIIEKIVHRPSSIVHRTFCEVNDVRPEEIYHTGFREDKKHAYVVISEGCDNYCTYCVVPYVRGRLRHRPFKEILREIREAVDCGITCITLLGQNVNSYHDAGRNINFVGLLRDIACVCGIKELTFLTCHPKDTTKELFEAIRDIPVIKKSLHLPLQSGSDKILKLMNRGYTAKRYLEIVDQYRSIVYNGQISTDIIVGFPGETEEDFKKTFELFRDISFNGAFLFKYSPRPNTQAIELKDDVALEVKKRRHAELLKFQREVSKKKENRR